MPPAPITNEDPRRKEALFLLGILITMTVITLLLAAVAAYNIAIALLFLAALGAGVAGYSPPQNPLDGGFYFACLAASISILLPLAISSLLYKINRFKFSISLALVFSIVFFLVDFVAAIYMLKIFASMHH